MNKFLPKFMQKGGGIFACFIAAITLFCGCSEDNAPKVSVSQSLIKVSCSASTTPVFVTSNTPWEAVIVDPDVAAPIVFSTTTPASPAWCRLSKSAGKESMSINVIIDDWHEFDTHRNAVITFRTLGDDASYATILIEQTSEDAWDEQE